MLVQSDEFSHLMFLASCFRAACSFGAIVNFMYSSECLVFSCYIKLVVFNATNDSIADILMLTI